MRRDEKQSGIDVGESFANNIFDTFTVRPPMVRIIIRIWNRNDADGDIMAKSFLKEEASAPRVNIFRQNIDTAHSQIVFAKPSPQSNG